MGLAKEILDESKKPILLSLGLLVVCVVGLILTKNSTSLSLPTSSKKTYTQPKQILQQGIDYKAIIETTSGNIQIDLYEKEAPITVNNFIFLAQEKFFDNLTFHRVVNGFVIQTGDPLGNGKGGPGYTFQDEVTGLKYDKYTVGMANAGHNTNGSQFFITCGDISEDNLNNLDNGGYTIFGKVTSGFPVVDSIERAAVDNNDKPLNDITIKSVQIIQS